MGQIRNNRASAGSPSKNLLSDIIYLALQDLLPASTVIDLPPTHTKLIHHRSALSFFRSSRLDYLCNWLDPDPEDVRREVRRRCQ